MEYAIIIVVLIVGYLIGSVNAAILFGKLFAGEDIRSHGSGNAGATNALRTYGKKAGVIVLLCDCLKAVVSVSMGVLVARLLFAPNMRDLVVYAVGVGTVLGHNFPIYFGFKGGKGVVVSATTIFFVDWRIGLIVLVAAIAVMAITRYVSLGSITGAVVFVVAVLIFHMGNWQMSVYSIILAGLLIYMHRANIGRLIKGTENKLGKKREV